MAEKKIFVGRKAELEQFTKVLEDPRGQAILVVGQAGMGKTWLINKMAEIAEKHPDLKCGCVRYEVTPTDSVDSTIALMMDNALDAAQVTERSFNGTSHRLEQWRSVLNVINIGDLVMSLRRDPEKNTRDQFLERLRLVSGRMPENGRAIFIIDPEKYMQKESDQSWAIVVKDLPEKIKFVFAQRPEDVLVESETIGGLDNVICIPEERLDVLDKKAVDELLNQRIGDLEYSITEVRKVLNRYKGHPYALGAALDLLEAGEKLEELPKKPEPTKFAEKQWQKVCDNKDGAIELFEAYAVLEVGVPDDVVEFVSGLKPAKRKSIMADKYIRGLLREEGEGKRIYHAILADYVLGQIGEEENKKYHDRAVEAYREKLEKAEIEQTKPDALAATRLAEHVLLTEGEDAFVNTFVNEECTGALLNLGLLDEAISLSERALRIAKEGSEEQAMVLGNLGLIYQTRGELDKAEHMHKKSLEISEKFGRLEGVASQYCNLGLIYKVRGELGKAEEMHKRALKINERIGQLEWVAKNCGNLGLIYQTRGELNKAEEMHTKSLEISEKLGLQKIMAGEYGNLGLIYQRRGELDKAEKMHKRALKINERIGQLEWVANNYGNLGLIYRTRGDLDRAEKMHKKSLEISEKLGQLEGVASQYAALGLVYDARGDLKSAEEWLLKGLRIEEQIGHLEGIAQQYGNLGTVNLRMGELDKAEETFSKVFKIEEQLGRSEGIANAYGNLGLIYGTRGKLDKAEEMYKKALEIDERIGLRQETANSYDNLGVISKQRGDIKKAREYWEKALELYKKIGMKPEVEKTQRWINSIDK